jgi:hypothetical protein
MVSMLRFGKRAAHLTQEVPGQSRTHAGQLLALDIVKWLGLAVSFQAWQSGAKAGAMAGVLLWFVAVTYSFLAATGLPLSNGHQRSWDEKRKLKHSNGPGMITIPFPATSKSVRYQKTSG